VTEREDRAWHIITGEYPPANGGVSDYTRLVARGLAARGDEVHVWAPGTASGLVRDAGVEVHALPGTFGPRALRELTARLDASPGPRRLLVQYVPHAFGLKAMNVPFCAWLAARRSDEVWIMFHEVVYPWRKDQRVREAVLAAVTRLMAAIVVWRADRMFVSVPFWGPYMRTFLPTCPTPTWLPIPSNLPTTVDDVECARVRERLTGGAPMTVVGHFGTYGARIAQLLAGTVRAYPEPPRRLLWLMLGRGGPAFVRAHFPDRTDIVAPGELTDAEVAAHLAACDVVVQPYPDGVSARRTSAMASLALGRPLVTNDGEITETVWREGGVAIAARPDPVLLAAALDAIVRDPARAVSLSAAGRSLYETEFSIERTMRTLHQNVPGKS
jgi:glycosyltransferase involved in cell wall biosynthesis